MAQVTKTVVKTQGGSGAANYSSGNATGIELYLYLNAFYF